MPTQTISVTETAGMIRRRQAIATPLLTASSLMSAASAASTVAPDPSVASFLRDVTSACSCYLKTATTEVETVFVTSTSVGTSNQICPIDMLKSSDSH